MEPPGRAFVRGGRVNLEMFHVRIAPVFGRPLECFTAHLAVLSTLDTCCTVALTASLAARQEWEFVNASLAIFGVTTLVSFCALAQFREHDELVMFAAIVLQLGVPAAAVLRLRTPDIHAPDIQTFDFVHSSWLVPALLAAQAFGGAVLHAQLQVIALLRFGPSPLACLALSLAVRSVAAAIVANNTVSLELLTVGAQLLCRAYELCAYGSRLLAFSLLALAFRDGALAPLKDVLLSGVVLRLLLRRASCSWAAAREELARTALLMLAPVWLHYGEYAETTLTNVVLAAWLTAWELLGAWLALRPADASPARLALLAHLTSLPPSLVLERQRAWLATLSPQLVAVLVGLLATLSAGKLYALAGVAARFHGMRLARQRRSLSRIASWEAEQALRQAPLLGAAMARSDGGPAGGLAQREAARHAVGGRSAAEALDSQPQAGGAQALRQASGSGSALSLIAEGEEAEAEEARCTPGALTPGVAAPGGGAAGAAAAHGGHEHVWADAVEKHSAGAAPVRLSTLPPALQRGRGSEGRTPPMM